MSLPDGICGNKIGISILNIAVTTITVHSLHTNKLCKIYLSNKSFISKMNRLVISVFICLALTYNIYIYIGDCYYINV